MSLYIVGLDGSARAPAVLSRAAHLARAGKAKLLVVRSVGLPHELSPDLYGFSPDVLPDVLVAAARKELDPLVASTCEGIEVEIDALIGTPWRTLCNLAKEKGADLLIVGTHGHNVLDTLLGTTAARVVNHAPCSVLVVRDHTIAAT